MGHGRGQRWTEVARLGPLKRMAWVLYELDPAKCKSRDITKKEILFAQLQIQISGRNDPHPKSIAGSRTTIVIVAALLPEDVDLQPTELGQKASQQARCHREAINL